VEVAAPAELADVRAVPQAAVAARGQADIPVYALRLQKAFMDGEKGRRRRRPRPFSLKSVSQGSG
jgi:hypothetical protein